MSYSDNNSFEQILERTMANPQFTELDKRPGSIVYDSLAPVCMELADAYVKMDILQEQTYLLTATGSNLDKRVYDYGVKRIQATKSKLIASFKKYKLDERGNPEKDEHGKEILIDMDIPIGSRFSIPDGKGQATYIYIGKEQGHDILECEQYGSIGNSYIGLLLPIVTIKDLIECSISKVYIPARDTELDLDLKKRTQEIINHRAFGGNIPDYIERVKALGAGNCKVFPAWNGGNGQVLLSIVDSQYNPASTEFQKKIKKEIDPEELTGQGYGIAPIGHYVTVTTPVKKMVTISIKIELENEYSIGTVREAVEKELEKYFNTERHKFKQNVDLAIFKARIIDYVLNVQGIVNVSSVLLNGSPEDIKYTDEDLIGKQYLPYIQEVIIG